MEEKFTFIIVVLANHFHIVTAAAVRRRDACREIPRDHRRHLHRWCSGERIVFSISMLTLMVMFHRFPRLLPRSWRGPSLRWEPRATWPPCRTWTPCNLGPCAHPDHPLVNLQSLSVETNILSYLKHFAEIFMKINRHRNNSVCVKYTLWNKYTCTL